MAGEKGVTVVVGIVVLIVKLNYEKIQKKCILLVGWLVKGLRLRPERILSLCIQQGKGKDHRTLSRFFEKFTTFQLVSLLTVFKH